MSELLYAKDFNTIVDDELESARAIQNVLTDYNVGSVFRTLLEVYALELDDLYRAMVSNLEVAIPTSIYTAFDFGILAAAPATGTVLFTLDDPVELVDGYTIPSGTTVKNTGNRITYQTTTDLLIPLGETSVSGTVLCDESGSVGNCLADAIDYCSLPNMTVSNPLPFLSGRDLETPLERKMRFREFVLSFARATVASLIYAAKLATIKDSNGYITEYVTGVGIYEEFPGQVDLYIATGTTDPSDEILELVQKYIDGYIDTDGTKVAGYRAAGIKVLTHKVTYQEVPITIRLIPAANIDKQTLAIPVLTALDKTMTAVAPGDTFYLSSAVAAMSKVPGVAGVHIITPSDDILVPHDKALVRSTTEVL